MSELLTLSLRLSPDALRRKLILAACIISLFRSLPKAHDLRWGSERRSNLKSKVSCLPAQLSLHSTILLGYNLNVLFKSLTHYSFFLSAVLLWLPVFALTSTQTDVWIFMCIITYNRQTHRATESVLLQRIMTSLMPPSLLIFHSPPLLVFLCPFSLHIFSTAHLSFSKTKWGSLLHLSLLTLSGDLSAHILFEYFVY